MLYPVPHKQAMRILVLSRPFMIPHLRVLLSGSTCFTLFPVDLTSKSFPHHLPTLQALQSAARTISPKRFSEVQSRSQTTRRIYHRCLVRQDLWFRQTQSMSPLLNDTFPRRALESSKACSALTGPPSSSIDSSNSHHKTAVSSSFTLRVPAHKLSCKNISRPFSTPYSGLQSPQTAYLPSYANH